MFVSLHVCVKVAVCLFFYLRTRIIHCNINEGPGHWSPEIVNVSHMPVAAFTTTGQGLIYIWDTFYSNSFYIFFFPDG